MRKLFVLCLVTVFLAACTVQVEPQKVNYKADGKAVQVFTTAADTDLRLTPTADVVFAQASQPLESEVSVFINPEKSFQIFVGIGAAITDASAEVFAKLQPEEQAKFLTAYFDKKEGIGYTLARTNIHSCDFSSGSYTYIEEGDSALATFDISHDKDFRIPLIKKSIEAAGGKLTLFASPWSPPAFMKDSNNMLRGGKLLPQYADAWAMYYTKFIKAYEAEGIPIWGISVQNEPMATQRWESCIYSAEDERDFLKNHLGPIMAKEGLGDKKIIVWDHNRDLICNRANTILEDPEAAKYVWGIGFHWYEVWAGGQPMYENLGNVHDSYPDVNLIFTEGCVESFDAKKYQYWPNAERYGKSMINDFNQGTVAWTDWNILLDENGGPNHVQNFCFAPLHGDTQTGKLIFTPSYYYIGHFSKFIQPDAKRISCAASRSHLLTTAFMNPDGKIVTVVMNHTDQPIDYKMYVGMQAVKLSILPHAMQTLIF